MWRKGISGRGQFGSHVHTKVPAGFVFWVTITNSIHLFIPVL